MDYLEELRRRQQVTNFLNSRSIFGDMIARVMLYHVLSGFSMLTSAIADVLAPNHCLCCASTLTTPISLQQAQHHFVCQRCMDALPPAPVPEELLANVARHFPQDILALHRITARFQYSESLGNDDYIASIQPLIYALKYGNRPRLGVELGRELAELLASQSASSYDALVPVPLHTVRIRERGYNQAEYIAKGIAAILHIPVQPTWIRRSRYTRSQTLLSAKERTRNLQNVIVGGKQRDFIKNMRILLVDDVITTGATLNSCALALLECGAQRVDAVVIAKA